MFKEIPNTLLKINIETMELLGLDALVKIEDSNNIKLELKNKEIIHKDINWIKHLLNLNLCFPDEDLDIVKNIEFKKYAPYGVSRDYSWIPILIEPKEIIFKDIKYRALARYPFCYISNCGKLLKRNNDSFIEEPIIITHNNYSMVHIIDSAGFVYYRSIHRIVAIAWIQNDDYVNKNIVDHNDNNKQNNHYSNLRWVDRFYNMSKEQKHFGLDKYIIRRISDGKISYCNMLSEVSSAIGRTKIDIVGCPLREGRVWKGKNGKFEISLNKENINWFYSDTTNTKYKFRIDTDNRIVYLVSIKDVRRFINKKSQNYNILVKEAREKNMILTASVAPQLLVWKEVKDIITKKILLFKTTREIAKYIGISKSMVIKSLSLKAYNQLHNDRYLIRLKSEDKWADDIGDIYQTQKKITPVYLMPIDKINKEIVFDSIQEASKQLLFSSRSILFKAKKKTLVTYNNNFYFITIGLPK